MSSSVVLNFVWDSYKLFITSRWINIKLCFLNPFKRYQDLLSKKAKCVLITIASSNINEVTGAILNSFIQNFYNYKKAQTLTSKQK